MLRRRAARSLIAVNSRRGSRRGRESAEQLRRHTLGQWTGRALGSDAGRAPRLARTAVDQFSRSLDQLIVHAVERLAESDAAWIVVVDEDRRRGGQLGLSRA